MRAILILLAVAALILLVAMQFGFVRLDQTQRAQLPKFDADVARVSVGTENKTVAVPDISIQKPGQKTDSTNKK